MSYNVLVIPEDFRKDQHILKPVVRAILHAAGKTNATLRICQNPLLGGTGQALNQDRILGIVRQYPMVDLFLLCVDRDGQNARRSRLDSIERHVAKHGGKKTLAENAWQEVEVWVLAGMSDLPNEWTWRDIRTEVDLKERFYLPYVRQRGLDGFPDQGRKKLGAEAARNYNRIRSRCPEDVKALEARIRKL